MPKSKTVTAGSRLSERAGTGWLFAGLMLALSLSGCFSNNPYRVEEAGRNTYYGAFGGPPKHLDPAISYSSGEYTFISQIYEPPLQYHYLKRPYELIPLTASGIPVPVYYGPAGDTLRGDPQADSVDRVTYLVDIRPGILYQPHPCFAVDEQGRSLYCDLDGVGDPKTLNERLGAFEDIADFPITGTRELIAADYVYQIKRLADPRLQCPIFSAMTKYIVGLDALGQELNGELTNIRSERRRLGGALYNRERDERENPIWLDLDQFDLRGVRVVDRYTYEVELSRKYPQFVYWLAMPFFAPIPREADRFFAQEPLVRRNLKIDNRPIGTGPYRMERLLAHKEIVFVRNENYRVDHFPSEGDVDDGANGLLADAGAQIPFIDRVVYKREQESIPRWSKFLQGYYETSGIATEVFDQVVQFGAEGGLDLSEKLSDQGIRLVKSVEPTTRYFAFNMTDDIVGGYGELQQKLRQAVSIVVDIEEWIQIFSNGRGEPAQDLLPPGIFGHRSDRSGINRFVYEWDEVVSKPRRKSIDEARALLAEAGFAGGKDADGRPLVLYFDTYWTGPGAKARTDWLRKQFAKLNIDLEIRQSDYNRFIDKVAEGNYQIILWGWHADYPDPENFLFLLYGPNGRIKYGGANSSNYDNPEFNRLFKLVESMQNGPERAEMLEEMLLIARRDAPWIWGYHPVQFGLYHEWYRNAKPMAISMNTLKYKKIDPQLRERRRSEWNEPTSWPLWLGAAVLALTTLPAMVAFRRREREVNAPS